MKKVEATYDELKTLYTTCANLMGPMPVWLAQFIPKTESDHKFNQSEKTIASRMDHMEHLLHPLRNTIEMVGKGLNPLQQEVYNLKQALQQLQQNPLTASEIPGTWALRPELTVLEAIKQHQQEHNTKIERQQIEIKNLQQQLQYQAETMQTVYATKLDCETKRRQVFNTKKSSKGRPHQSALGGVDNKNLEQLQDRIQEIRTKLGNLANQPKSTPVHNPLFPNLNQLIYQHQHLWYLATLQ